MWGRDDICAKSWSSRAGRVFFRDVGGAVRAGAAPCAAVSPLSCARESTFSAVRTWFRLKLCFGGNSRPDSCVLEHFLGLEAGNSAPKLTLTAAQGAGSAIKRLI